MLRETREQRLALRQAQANQRQKEGAAELVRALQRQITADNSSCSADVSFVSLYLQHKESHD